MSRLLPLCFLPLILGCGGNNDAPSPFGAKPAGPTAQKEGVKWTHRELFVYLKGKGLDVDAVPLEHEKNPAAFFDAKGVKGVLVVALMSTPQAAAAYAGLHGERGYAWGRFAFREQGEGELFNRVKAALSGGK